MNLLLAEVPPSCQDDLRLGLQEALVNAAKHGNCLDPNKVIHIRFARIHQRCWWIIGDQGHGFTPVCRSRSSLALEPSVTPIETQEESWRAVVEWEEQDCGRGIFLMQHVFDEVRWNPEGNELTLCKYLPRSIPLSLFPFWPRAA
ncbi:MAG: ATP-binding protein [Prochlorothrix sp.]|nr:ATP-binding protein [Prochlorothrix sp.]